MTLSLINVTRYYQGKPHQDQALTYLQQQLEATQPNLLADNSEFARRWRNLNPVSPDRLISAEGIGLAQLGMTYGAFKQQLGEAITFQVRSPFIVDFDAIAVVLDGQDLFYILYPASTTLTDVDTLESLVTENPSFRTAAGVGPGVLLQQGIQAYGAPSFSYSLANESREFVKFANQPSPRIGFSPVAPCYQFAGIYSEPVQEFNQTNAYQANTSLCRVWVS